MIMWNDPRLTDGMQYVVGDIVSCQLQLEKGFVVVEGGEKGATPNQPHVVPP